MEEHNSRGVGGLPVYEYFRSLSSSSEAIEYMEGNMTPEMLEVFDTKVYCGL
jgi:hypothetical protein